MNNVADLSDLERAVIEQSESENAATERASSDQASAEQGGSEGSSRVTKKLPRKSWAEKLPDLLRQAGAIAVLVSLYTFLSKGWAGSNDLIKYCMLFANTIGLAGIALLIGHFFKEGKSPRLLLTLGLVSVPINFAILGAFIFYGASDFIGVSYPSYVAWKVDSLSTALITSTLATFALIPVIWLGFRTLARGMSHRMTAFFVLSNVLLLVPFRDPNLVAGMAILLGLLTLMISAKTARQKIEAQTKEGRMALLLQFIPLGILVGRNLWLYAADEVVVWAASAMTFIAIRQITFLLRSNTLIRSLLNGLSLITAMSTGLLTSIFLLEMNVVLSFSMLLGVLFAAGMTYEISLRSGINENFYRVIAMSTVIMGCLFNVVQFGGIVTSLITLLIGAGLLVLSYIVQQRSLSIAGSALTIFGVIDQCLRAFQWFDLGSWIVLLVVGVTAIIIASVLDTQSDKLKYFLKQRRQQLGEWRF